jgi:excisionase family DNA binding protein
LDDEFLTIHDVAAQLKLAERTVYAMAAEREMPAFKVRGQWRIRQIRAAYKRKMVTLIHRMSNVLGVAGSGREERAWSIVAIMIGAIAISRAMADGKEADQVLHAALRTATALGAPK